MQSGSLRNAGPFCALLGRGEGIWRIVTSIDENVAIEYGADLHFQWITARDSRPSIYVNCFPLDEEYAISGWNNLPNLEA